MPFVGTTTDFQFSRGGKQGGVETPDEWRAILDYILEPVINLWNAFGLGCVLPDTYGETEILVNHAVWADNIFLFATDHDTMQTMINQLTEAFSEYTDSAGRRYFLWKPGSLESVVAGSLAAGALPETCFNIDQNGECLAYQRKTSITILGDFLSNDGCSAASFQHNTGRAEAIYFKHQQVLRNASLPVGKRLRAWHNSPLNAAIYNSGNWHITAGLMREVRTWELQLLRRLLRLRRRPEEGAMNYNMRTSSMICKWLSNSRLDSAHVKVIRFVYKAAWREKAFHLDGGDAPLKQVRSYRDAMWWQTWQAISTRAERQRLGIRHAQVGQQKTAWEHPFVTVWGLDWRSRLQNAATLSEWMKSCGEFVETLCDKWHLPVIAETKPVLSLFMQTIKLKTTIHDPPDLLFNPKQEAWGEGHRRIWIQTDNQQVAAIFNGSSLLCGDGLRPPCVRIARLLSKLLQAGCLPRKDTTAIIEWDPREFNGVADHAANCALDMRSAWELRADRMRHRLVDPHVNYRICVDGARRGGGHASGGMLVLAYTGRGDPEYLYRAGVGFGCLDSAFSAEVLAMEWALEEFFKYFVDEWSVENHQ